MCAACGDRCCSWSGDADVVCVCVQPAETGAVLGGDADVVCVCVCSLW